MARETSHLPRGVELKRYDTGEVTHELGWQEITTEASDSVEISLNAKGKLQFSVKCYGFPEEHDKLLERVNKLVAALRVNYAGQLAEG